MQTVTVAVACGERSYDIHIEGGGLSRLGAFARERYPKAKRACVVTSATVAGLYLREVCASLEAAGYMVMDVVIPDGEEHKTIATWESILTRLIAERFERTSMVVALGGGVVGDIAGFVAASFLRGIPILQVPTTIVAQVDSSIGGKVAVNHPLGKNLIGSFYQPGGVYVDTRTLSTLAPREVVSGMAEAVKHAIIRDTELFAFYEEHVETLMNGSAPDGLMERFIAANCRIKAAVVSADEREGGVRAILNYGHTVGHAVETVAGYGTYSHGAAVILGMIAAARIAVRKGLMPSADMDRQNGLLARVGIPALGAGFTYDTLHEAMTRDKKVADGRIRFVLSCGIGDARVHDDVTIDDMKDGIEYMIETAAKHGRVTG